MTDKPATVKEVKEFFGMNLAEMKAEWIPLPAADKAQIGADLAVTHTGMDGRAKAFSAAYSPAE